MVGAVLVDDELRLLGEGFHQKFGQPHAEVEAIRDAEAHGHKERLKEATLFVSLEPCCHFGKTPPCTQAILVAGIRKVVVGRSDPAPQVHGAGIAELMNYPGVYLGAESELAKIRAGKGKNIDGHAPGLTGPSR